MKAPTPRPDACDSNPQVKPHLSLTPGLTPLPSNHRFEEGGRNSLCRCVRRELEEVFRDHGLARCPHLGLYYAGSPKYLRYPDRDRTVLLVVELREWDSTEWREMDDEVRLIMTKYDLDGLMNVCVRYYVYWRDNTDTDDEGGAEAQDERRRRGLHERFQDYLGRDVVYDQISYPATPANWLSTTTPTTPTTTAASTPLMLPSRPRMEVFTMEEAIQAGLISAPLRRSRSRSPDRGSRRNALHPLITDFPQSDSPASSMPSSPISASSTRQPSPISSMPSPIMISFMPSQPVSSVSSPIIASSTPQRSPASSVPSPPTTTQPEITPRSTGAVPRDMQEAVRMMHAIHIDMRVDLQWRANPLWDDHASKYLRELDASYARTRALQIAAQRDASTASSASGVESGVGADGR